MSGLTLEKIAEDRRNSEHSIFSPSGSKMWLGCSGSLIPNILAEDSAGPEAAEGTVAHWLGEGWLNKGRAWAKNQIGKEVWQDGYLIEIDEDMFAHVRDYVDFCNAVDGHKLVEQRVNFSRLTPITHQTGTADHINMREGHIDVTDLKFGRGVPVYAEDNTQAMIYGLGALFEWDFLYNFKTITLRIAQPRLDYWGEVTIERDELMQFAGYVKERARLAWSFDAPRSPSPEACLWCKVAATCPARAKMLEDIADDTFAELVEYDADDLRRVDQNIKDDLGGDWIDPIQPVELSNKSLERILEHRKPVEKWFNSIQELLLDRAVADGVKLDRFKVVQSRANRQFVSREKFVVAGLVRAGLPPSECYQTDFVSPAEAERRLRAKCGLKLKDAKEVVNDLTVNPPGKMTLAPVKDRRDDIGNVADVFDELTSKAEDND